LIHGYIDANAQLIFQNSSQNNLYLSGTNASFIADATGSNFPGYFLKVGGTIVGQITADSTNSFQIVGGTTTTPILFTQAGAERARIDSSGRLLVGTSTARDNVRFSGTNTAPATQFETAVASYNNGLSLINNSTSGFPSNIWIGSSAGSTIGSNTLITNQTLGNINFVGADGTNLIHGARIHADTDGTTGSGDLPTRLVFSTTDDGASSPTERLRIASGGQLSAFSAGDALWALTAVGAGTATALIRGYNTATSTTAASGNSFIVWSNGNVVNTNNSYGAISDVKLKENIVDANSQWDDLKALQVRNYNFKEGQTHTQIGLVAQEAELVSPGLVSESPDRDEDGNDLGTVTKSVNYSVLYMKAVKALQEAMERIEALETEMAEVKTQLQSQ
jgi:hypothetical protein